MKKIIINNLTWEVSFVDDSRLDNALGECVPHELKIKISRSLMDDFKRRIIIHELTHAWLYSYGYNTVADDVVWSEEGLCEVVCSSLDRIYDLTNEVLDD